MNILFIGDIVGRPGRELIRVGLRALVGSLQPRSRDRQRGEFGRRVRHHQRHRRHAARMGRRCHDVGQSHLGQEGGDALHRWASRVCFGRPTILPVCQAAEATSRRPATGAPSASSTSWVGSSCSTSTTRSRSSSARSTRSGIARASSSSTSTRKRRAKKWRWDGTSTARSRRCSARTPTCRRPMNECCRVAPRT